MRRTQIGTRRNDRAGSDLVTAFRDAYERGDITQIARVLGANVRVVADSGGVIPGTIEPGDGVTEAMALLTRALGPPGSMELLESEVNGRGGLIGRVDEKVVAVIGLDGCIGGVTNIWIVLNPEKLSHWRH